MFLILVCTRSLQSCLILWDSMDYSSPDSSVHGILQARILEWVAISYSRVSSQPRDWTQVLALQADSLLSLSLGKPDQDTRCVHCQRGAFASRPSQWADLGNKTIDNPHTYIYIFLCVCAYTCLKSSICISLSEFINSHSWSNAVFPKRILIYPLG